MCRLGLQDMDKISDLDTYAQYLDIDTTIFDILTLGRAKDKLYLKKMHDKKWTWKSTLIDF